MKALRGLVPVSSDTRVNDDSRASGFLSSLFVIFRHMAACPVACHSARTKRILGTGTLREITFFLFFVFIAHPNPVYSLELYK